MQLQPDGMMACQSVVSAEDPAHLPTFDGDGVELGVAFIVRVAVAVGSAVQTDAAVDFGVELIDQTATPAPMTAISTIATMAITPYFADPAGYPSAGRVGGWEGQAVDG